MPLKEKIAQLCGAHLQDLLENGKISFEKCREVIPNGIGHICQFSSGVTCTASRFLLTELLRNEWDFDGMVVSDYGAISKIYGFYYYTENLEEAALAAIKARC